MAELLNHKFPNYWLDPNYLGTSPDPSLSELQPDLAFLDNNQDVMNAYLTRDNLLADVGSGTDWGQGITRGTALVNGATGIANTVMNASRIHENPVYNARLNETIGAGSRNYSTVDQIAGSMGSLNRGLRQDEDVVRGMTNGQKFSAVGSAIMNGAAAGKQFGWIGSLIGGAVGGLAGAASIGYGDSRARMQTDYDNLQGQFAQSGMNATAQGEHERLMGNNHRDSIYRGVAARGGQLQTEKRKQESIQQFANRVLGNKTAQRIVRTKCKGGVMIKINR